MDVRERPSGAMTAVVYVASLTTLYKLGVWATIRDHGLPRSASLRRYA